MWKELFAIALTASIWGVYTYGILKIESLNNHAWLEWLGALLFPVVVCGLIALNIWLRTPLAGNVFICFICFGLLWGLLQASGRR
jgi:hypothetical protein